MELQNFVWLYSKVGVSASTMWIQSKKSVELYIFKKAQYLAPHRGQGSLLLGIITHGRLRMCLRSMEKSLPLQEQNSSPLTGSQGTVLGTGVTLLPVTSKSYRAINIED